MTGAVAAFELERFEWDEGVFEVAGRWTGDSAPARRPRLLVEVDGRRRRLNAVGRPNGEDGPWTARFTCARRPEVVGPAELEVGDLVIELPPPYVTPEPPPDVREAELLLESLREERLSLEAAVKQLAEQRAAATEAAERLAAGRAELEAAEQALRETAAEAARQAAQEAAETAARSVAEQTARSTACRAARSAASLATASAAARPA